MTALEEILDGVEQLETDALAAFEDLARRLQKGQEHVEPAEVAAVLKAAGKDRNDLRSFVKSLADRDQLRANIIERDRLAARNAALKAEIEAKVQAFEQQVEAHRTAVRPLRNEISSNNDTLSKLTGMEQKLFETCTCEALRDQLATVQFRQEQLRDKLGKASDSLHRMKSQIGSHNYVHFPGERARIDAAVARLSAEVDALAQEQAGTPAQVKAVVQAMREW